jgi:hypothetical protein
MTGTKHDGLKRIRGIYMDFRRWEPELEGELVPWGSLSVELRRAFIHMYHCGAADAHEQRGQSPAQAS